MASKPGIRHRDSLAKRLADPVYAAAYQAARPEDELREGYEANAEVAAQTMEDFRFVDAETARSMPGDHRDEG